MNIVRPLSGFIVSEAQTANATLSELFAARPDLQKWWVDVKLRLAYVGHKEGASVPFPGLPHARVIRIAHDYKVNTPWVRIAYTVLGSRLEIIAVQFQ